MKGLYTFSKKMPTPASKKSSDTYSAPSMDSTTSARHYQNLQSAVQENAQ